MKKDYYKIPVMTEIPAEKEAAVEQEGLRFQKRYRQKRHLTFSALAAAAASAVLLASMFLPVLQVYGTSMEPTLLHKDIIVLMKTEDIETGDLIGFYCQKKLLLKRVIGQPGEVIDIDDEGNVFVNGEMMEEPYVMERSLGEYDIAYPFQIPDDEYFVLGDNRTISIDSRSSIIGCVAKNQIVGKVILRIWPLKRITIIH